MGAMRKDEAAADVHSNPPDGALHIRQQVDA